MTLYGAIARQQQKCNWMRIRASNWIYDIVSRVLLIVILWLLQQIAQMWERYYIGNWTWNLAFLRAFFKLFSVTQLKQLEIWNKKWLTEKYYWKFLGYFSDFPSFRKTPKDGVKVQEKILKKCTKKFTYPKKYRQMVGKFL